MIIFYIRNLALAILSNNIRNLFFIKNSVNYSELNFLVRLMSLNQSIKSVMFFSSING